MRSVEQGLGLRFCHIRIEHLRILIYLLYGFCLDFATLYNWHVGITEEDHPRLANQSAQYTMYLLQMQAIININNM